MTTTKHTRNITRYYKFPSNQRSDKAEGRYEISNEPTGYNAYVEYFVVLGETRATPFQNHIETEMVNGNKGLNSLLASGSMG